MINQIQLALVKLIPTFLTQFLRTCFAASTPLRWSVVEEEETPLAAESLAKSEAEEDDACASCFTNLPPTNDVRCCTNCEDVVAVDSEAATAADWETKDEDAAATAAEEDAAATPDAPLTLPDLCLHLWRLKKW